MSKPSESINALGNIFAEYARGPKAFAMLTADCLFSTNMPFLRVNIGERVLSAFFVMVMSIVAIAMCFVMKVDPTFVYIYLGLLWAMTIYHLFVIHRRNSNDKPVHTRYSGDFVIAPVAKKLPKGTNYWWLESFYEPLLVGVTGLLIYTFLDKGLGNLLLFTVPWMFLRSQYARMIYRNQMLDEMDAYLESQYKLDAINGKPASETAGVIVKNVNHMRPTQKEALAKRMLGDKDFSEMSS